VNDPRGGELTESTHEVKTLAKALEWMPRVKHGDLPITITQHKTRGGRVGIRIYSSDNKLIHSRG